MEPIAHIARMLEDVRRIKAADVGCGAGRYDIRLFQHLGNKIEHLYCLDATQRMLEQVRGYLQNHHVRDFEAVRSDAQHLPFGPRRLNCIFTFNAIHHFHVPRFLNEASRVLKRRGHLFVYTRFRDQNRQNIWGMYFPLFCDKETRLFESDDLKRLIRATPKLRAEDVTFFKYHRRSTLNRLLELVRHRHYSTFSHYTESELLVCQAQFEENIRSTFKDVENLRWTDENAMLTVRKE